LRWRRFWNLSLSLLMIVEGSIRRGAHSREGSEGGRRRRMRRRKKKKVEHLLGQSLSLEPFGFLVLLTTFYHNLRQCPLRPGLTTTTTTTTTPPCRSTSSTRTTLMPGRNIQPFVLVPEPLKSPFAIAHAMVIISTIQEEAKEGAIEAGGIQPGGIAGELQGNYPVGVQVCRIQPFGGLEVKERGGGKRVRGRQKVDHGNV